MINFWVPGQTIADVEQISIEAAMRYYGNNQTQAAKALDISTRTLHEKLKQYRVREIEKNGLPTERGLNVEPSPKVPKK